MPVEHENRTGWHEPCIEWNMGEGEYGCGRRRGFQGEIDLSRPTMSLAPVAKPFKRPIL